MACRVIVGFGFWWCSSLPPSSPLPVVVSDELYLAMLLMPLMVLDLRVQFSTSVTAIDAYTSLANLAVLLVSVADALASARQACHLLGVLLCACVVFESSKAGRVLQRECWHDVCCARAA
eukprot:539656-Amphidinium_carterae.1